MYAIVDIETTGGHASSNGITEIAIIIHDGVTEVSRFETLVNPEKPIPIYVRALTGITDEMVSAAPLFKDIAPQVYTLLHDKIFIAHSVNFDYSFLKHHLAICGFNLNCKKVCTVRLGRKVFPGLPSYSLGKFCGSLGIQIINRHRALGDAEAATSLFSLMIVEDKEGHLQSFLNPRSREQLLPPNLAKEKVDALPEKPGVYYFRNEKGKIIYIGKAKNLKHRVISHFSNNSVKKRKQDFLREIFDVTYEVCGTELMAFILEAMEIKRVWPKHNQSLKRYEQVYGMFVFEDQRGYLRLAIDKRNKSNTSLYSFNMLAEGYSLLRTLISDYSLCPRLCFLQKSADTCCHAHCKGACRGQENIDSYNSRVLQAVNQLKVTMPSFAIKDDGRMENETGWILIEEGRFYGMGYLPDHLAIHSINDLKPHLTPYSANDYVKNLVYSHAEKYPEKKFAEI